MAVLRSADGRWSTTRLLTIAVAGMAFGEEAAQGELLGQLRGLIGDEGAAGDAGQRPEAGRKRDGGHRRRRLAPCGGDWSVRGVAWHETCVTRAHQAVAAEAMETHC
jgi:hypothetical protein